MSLKLKIEIALNEQEHLPLVFDKILENFSNGCLSKSGNIEIEEKFLGSSYTHSTIEKKQKLKPNDGIEINGKKYYKGFPLYIYKSSIGDCSNGGISSEYEKVLWVGELAPQIFDIDDLKSVVVLKSKKVFGEVYNYFSPFLLEGHWVMNGGCFVSTSDSRFSDIFKGPIALHDRVE